MIAEQLQGATKIPLAELSDFGVAFDPLVSAVKTTVDSSNANAICYIKAMGKQILSNPEDAFDAVKAIGDLTDGAKVVLSAFSGDPTVLFMAAALVNIEGKLEDIHRTQKEIFGFLEEKERSVLQGNLNTLGDIINNFKYNWNNASYKTNTHILVQQIKKEAESSIALYRGQIAGKLNSRSLIHRDKDVKNMMSELKSKFSDYQLAVYLYGYASFLEIMLTGNFTKGYLDNVEQRILDYMLQYRTLYTDSYDAMENYSRSSVQAGVLSGLAVASRFMGKTISKVQAASERQLDENLMQFGNKLDDHGNKRTADTMEGFAQTNVSIMMPFVENIRTINQLYNKPVAYIFDNDAVYVQPLEE